MKENSNNTFRLTGVKIQEERIMKGNSNNTFHTGKKKLS